MIFNIPISASGAVYKPYLFGLRSSPGGRVKFDILVPRKTLHSRRFVVDRLRLDIVLLSNTSESLKSLN